MARCYARRSLIAAILLAAAAAGLLLVSMRGTGNDRYGYASDAELPRTGRMPGRPQQPAWDAASEDDRRELDLHRETHEHQRMPADTAPAPAPAALGPPLPRQRRADPAANRSAAACPFPRRFLTISVPTVRRDRASYLITTLESLVKHLDATERDSVRIAVYAAEPSDSAFVEAVRRDVAEHFAKEMQEGLIAVLRPSAQDYPPFENLIEKYNDSRERIRWRAKQCIDYAVVMERMHRCADYFLQLEDDVLTTHGYVTAIRMFVEWLRTCQPRQMFQTKCDPNWIVLQFSTLGAIGILFRDDDLRKVAMFYRSMYDEQPVDWLNDRLLSIRSQDVHITFSPPIFQHIGIHSSLRGKTQTLVERAFRQQMPGAFAAQYKAMMEGTAGAVRVDGEDPELISASDTGNPRATITTTLETHRGSAERCYYLRDELWWVTAPSANAFLMFTFQQPLHVEHVHVATGTDAVPTDILQVRGTARACAARRGATEPLTRTRACIGRPRPSPVGRHRGVPVRDGLLHARWRV